MNTRENRKNTRYAVKGLKGNLMYTSDLEVLNISIDGAAVETGRRLELNREYSFRMQDNNLDVTLRGRVVWAVLVCGKGGTAGFLPRYRAGIQFTDTVNEKQKVLRRFIEEHRLKTAGSRTGGIRFKITNTEALQVEMPRRYEVRKISMSGMLVETAYPLEINSHFDIELFVADTTVNILVRVANCIRRDSLENSPYEIGMEFVSMSEYDMDILKKFLDTFDR
ncbi:MAG: PilZ domain-containing protein [Nitrospirota bacterium]